MKTPEKLAAGWLLTVAFMFLAIAASALLEKPQNQQATLPNTHECAVDKSIEKKQSTALGGLMFGIPSLFLGGWLVLGLYGQGKKEERDRLDSTFYRLLKQGNGDITVLLLAMETQLPAAVAKQYLDQKAKEFDATFEVTDNGGIYYHFNDVQRHII
jgi:hypothetical protein